MRLIERMEAEVAGRIQAILDEAKKQAEAVAASAAKDVEALQASARLATDKRVQLERAKSLAKVTLAVKKDEAELKRGLVDKVFGEVQKKLEALPSSKDYAKVLEALVQEAASGTSGKLQASVREGDKGKVEGLLKKTSIEATIAEDLRGRVGGIVLRSADGSVVIDNSLATRLERVRVAGTLAAGGLLFEPPAKPVREPEPEHGHGHGHKK